MNPIIVYSDLTHRWYVATRYKDLGKGQYMASTKYDVTDQMEKIMSHILHPDLASTMEICDNCNYPRLRPDKMKEPDPAGSGSV